MPDDTAAMPDSRSAARARGARHQYRFLAPAVALLVMGLAITAAGRRSAGDLVLVFVHAPRQIVPEGHLRQVEIVRRAVPKGATLLYLMDKEEAWQLGLWQRSLYPDYLVVPFVAGRMGTPDYAAVRRRHEIAYALAAGDPPPDPGFLDPVMLPGYPNGIPLSFGRLPPP